jgi:hypothetical protein
MLIAPIPTSMIVPTVTATPTIAPMITPMQPVIEIVQQHSPIISGFDVRQIVGLGGMTFIEAFVKYLQRQWGVPTKGIIPVIVTMVCGIGLNLAIAAYLHMDMTNALIVGAFTGVSASGYHEATK